MATLRWMPRFEGADRMRPLLALNTRRRWCGIRFGREKYKSFSERNQGKFGIPVRWHYLFGGRLSFTSAPIPDDSNHPRFMPAWTEPHLD